MATPIPSTILNRTQMQASKYMYTLQDTNGQLLPGSDNLSFQQQVVTLASSHADRGSWAASSSWVGVTSDPTMAA